MSNGVSIDTGPPSSGAGRSGFVNQTCQEKDDGIQKGLLDANQGSSAPGANHYAWGQTARRHFSATANARDHTSDKSVTTFVRSDRLYRIAMST